MSKRENNDDTIIPTISKLKNRQHRKRRLKPRYMHVKNIQGKYDHQVNYCDTRSIDKVQDGGRLDFQPRVY